MRVIRPRKCSPSTTTASTSSVEEWDKALGRGIWRYGFELAGRGLLDGEVEIERLLRERNKQVQLVKKADAAVAFEHRNLGDVVKLHAAVGCLERIVRSHGHDGALVEAPRDEIAQIAVAWALQQPLIHHPAVVVHFRQVLVAGIADERDHPLRLGLVEAIALRGGDQGARG